MGQPIIQMPQMKHPEQFGYKKLRYLGIVLWIVASAAITIGLILYQVPPIDLLVEAAADIPDAIIANISVFMVVWIALHVPLVLLYIVYRYLRSWFTFK